LGRFAAAGVDLSGAASLEDLVGRYHRGSTGLDDGPRSTLEGLLALAPSDPDAALCALVALRPALYWVARRVHGPSASDEDLAEILGFAVEALHAPAPRSREDSRARQVVLLTRTRARSAARRRDERRREAPAALEFLDPTLLVVLGPESRAEPLLRTAVEEGVLQPAEAELIALTRAFGIPVKVLALDRGVTVKTLLQKRRRAETALRDRLDLRYRAR
jgi:hypothetical protein